MWQAVRDLIEPIAAQADAPQSGFGVGQAVRRVRQGVRVHAGFGHARAHASTVTRVRRLREVVFATMAIARPSAFSHGRKALWLRALRQSFCGSIEFARTHADALGGQKFRVHSMSQDVCAQELPQQTPRVGVRARRRR